MPFMRAPNCATGPHGRDSRTPMVARRADRVKPPSRFTRAMRDTWDIDDYDLSPKLRSLNVPTLVIAGDYEMPWRCSQRVQRFLSRHACGRAARVSPHPGGRAGSGVTHFS